MAKKFGGFTPQQQQTLLSKVGYTGPAQQDDINKFMMSSPKAASMMGQYAEMAKARVQGGPQTAMQEGGTVVGKGGQYFIKDAQGGYSQPYSTALDAYYANKGQTTNPTTGATVQPYAGLNTGTTDNMPNTSGGFDMGAGQQGQGNMAGTMGGANGDLGTASDLNFGGITPLPNPNPDLEFPDPKRDNELGINDGIPPIQKPDLGGYDPSKGLPTAPEKIDTGEILQDLNWAKHSQKGIDMLLESGKLPSDEMFIKTTNPDGTESLTPDPSKYTVSGGRENWIFTFEDGTSTVVNRAELSKAKQTLANEITPVISKLKQSGWEEKTKAAQDTYNKQLGVYKNYYGDQATVTPEGTRADYDTAQSNLSKEQNLLQIYTTQLANMAEDDPQRATIEGLIEEQKVKVTNAQQGLSQAQTNLERVGMPSTTEMRADILDDPIASGMVTEADVVTVSPEQREAGKIVEGTGQAAAVADTATQTEAAIAADVVAPTAKEAATYDATLVTDKAKAELDKVKAARLDEFSEGVIFEGEQGELSEGAYADEALKVAADRIQKVNEKLDLEVTKQQLAEAKGKNLKAIETKVAKSSALLDAVAAAHVVQPNELPTPQLIAEEDMAQAKAMTDTGLDKDAIPIAAKMASFSVDNGTLAKAAQGDVDSLATVEGQLGKLMKQFDDGTPAWAAGAIRAANAAMSSRGLGASSMAGAAILQAAMESALPIASQDAKTYADMGMQNLDNRQQVAIANAAAQQGLQLQNLDNEQKANLQKSINAFGLQTQNLSNRQASEVANAQIRATLQGQNLSNRQQANIAEAARYAEAANINLNNKQQAAMQDNSNALQTNLAELSAEQSAYINSANAAAALQGQVLSNEQQVSIANAARYSEAANIEFTAEQQNALHNSKLMSSIGLAELSATQAATLQNAASVANMDITNLNNRQQAAVQNAKSFLQRDMTNLNNEQQTAIFKAQATQQAILSDQAAENAAKQFNAASENQTNQFYDNLSTQVAMQNQEQTNAMNKFNAGEANVISQFNSAQQNARDQFNANNALVVAQANTQWEQAITTMDNAAQNQANRDAAQQANNLTETTYNNMLQQERDALDYAWRTADNALTRENSYAIAEMQGQAAVDTAKGEGTGKLLEIGTKFLLDQLV